MQVDFLMLAPHSTAKRPEQFMLIDRRTTKLSLAYLQDIWFARSNEWKKQRNVQL